ncbi:MAG: DUF4327 family protein [Kovacikia sp.]
MARSIHYSFAFIQEEVRRLVKQSLIDCRQPIYRLCKFIPAEDWNEVERELEEHDFLLRDRIGDLIPQEEWPQKE